MVKVIIKILKFVGLFLFFWFLNNGFLVEPIWLLWQAVFFTFIAGAMLKYHKVTLKFWFIFIGFLYLTSAVLEIFEIPIFPEAVASSGFGILVLLIVSHILIGGR